MKKLTAAIFIWLAISAAHAAEKSNKPQALRDTVNHDFKRVIVTGNTVVYFVQSRKNQVTLNEGDPRDISVTQTGNKLRISSNQVQPLVVTVYFKDLHRIEASGQSTVSSRGKVNLENLQIILYDDATGRIKANTNLLYTVTYGQSKLQLTGKTARHVLVGTQNLNMKNFTASVTEQKGNAEIAARWESGYKR